MIIFGGKVLDGLIARSDNSALRCCDMGMISLDLKHIYVVVKC